MDSKRLVAVLPCYSLDDLAKNLDETACREFHSAWTALWHPSILVQSIVLPEWKRSDENSLNLENAVVVGPESAMQNVDLPLRERLEVQGCLVIVASEDRAATVRAVGQALELDLDSIPNELSLPVVDDSDVPGSVDLWGKRKASIGIDDFYALGFAVLLVQHLTRKIHYSSNLDLVVMADQARSAASAYLNGDAAEAERWLQSCFDQLSQERDRYFNQSAYLIDLTLLAKSTLGSLLESQLRQSSPQNILAEAMLLDTWKSQNPDAWEHCRQRIENKEVCLVGGLRRERLHPWFPLGTLQRDLKRGRQAYEDLAVPPPKVFGRFAAGMTIEYPTHLKSNGYIGALLHAFSDGHYPVTSQAKISWEASDTTNIDTISGSIFDAASSRALFHSIGELAKQFDHHQIPTLVCVHWPSRISAALRDVTRATRRTNAFGEWTTLENYFETTGFVYSHQSFSSQEFRFDWPKTNKEFSEQADELQRRSQRNTQLESTRNLGNVVEQVLLTMKNKSAELHIAATKLGELARLLEVSDDLTRPILAIDASRNPNPSAESETTDAPSHQEILDKTRAIRLEFAEFLRSVFPRSKDSPTDKQRWLVFNPYSGPQRCRLSNLESHFTRTEQNRIYETYAVQHRSDVIVDVPPMGVVQLEGVKSEGLAGLVKSKKFGPNLANASWLMANEFIECQIDPEKGYLRSIMIAKKRGGRLSGMPAIVAVDATGRTTPTYSTIRNAKNRIVENNPMHARIESIGDLFVDDRKLASFETTYTLWRGARSLEIGLKLTMLEKPRNGGDLWQGAPVWRTAWPSQAADLATWLQGTKTKLRTVKIFAPELIEINDAEHRVYLAFQGLPIHRRVETTYLDTLLPIDEFGVVERKWSIGVDWPRPYQNYLELFDEPVVIPDPGGVLQAGSSLWFAQTGQPNVRIELLGRVSPESEESLANPTFVEPIRLLLHETQGREVRTKLSFFRDAATAARVEATGKKIEDLSVENGQVIVDAKPNEIAYIDVEWR